MRDARQTSRDSILDPSSFIPPPSSFSDAAWAAFLARWRRGAYRASFFRDLVLADLRRLGPAPALLDIGCGEGLDGEPAVQQSLAAAAGRCIGIEPDPSIPVGPWFTEVHRCAFEDAPLEPASVDVALAAFVLEHLRAPAAFWRKLEEVLAPGGVFWAFTIDRRHYFGLVSLLAERLGMKNWYLNRVGRTGTGPRRTTYPTFYRVNTPAAVRRQACRFRSVRIANLYQAGQLDAYLPRRLHHAAHLVDRLVAALGLPGPMLVVRAEKEADRDLS